MKEPIGELTQEDRHCLIEWSHGCKWAVDFGTYFGLSAWIIADQVVWVHTIDVFEDYSIIQNIGSRAHYKELFEKNPHYYEVVEASLQKKNNIKVSKGVTFDIIDCCCNNCIDFIFIDADHSYAGVKRDFDACFPKIAMNGKILFHDSNNSNWDVQDFITNEIMCRTDLKMVDVKGSITVFQRIRKD